MATARSISVLVCLVGLIVSLGGGTTGYAANSSTASQRSMEGITTDGVLHRLRMRTGTSLTVSRAHHTATLLGDGRVLVVGGTQTPDDHLAQVELFNPTTNTVTQVAPLHTARHDHTATLLPDGRVLVVGGYTLPQQWLDDAEIYDPTTDTWTVVPPLYKHGTAHTATLLPNGRVLVVGGCIGSWVCTTRVEIFDPVTDTWSEAAPLAYERSSHTAHLLGNGRVLIIGGWGSALRPQDGDALLYDWRTNTWTATPPMVTPRVYAKSVLLPDGRVLVTGGIPDAADPNPQLLSSAEIYNFTTNTWTATNSMAQPRYLHTLSVMPDGYVLAIGGSSNFELPHSALIARIEAYNPVTGRWRTVGTLPIPTIHAAATLLPFGRLWYTGGIYGGGSRDFQAGTVFLTYR